MRTNFERLDMVNSLSIGGNRVKRIKGVSPLPFVVWAQALGSDRSVCYHAGSPGRFSFEFFSNDDCALWFSDQDGSELSVSVELSDPPTVVVGDVESAFTVIGPRPVQNPQVEAVLRHMRLMEGEVRALRRETEAERGRRFEAETAARKAVVPSPSPAPSPAPQGASAPPDGGYVPPSSGAS